MGYVPPRPFPLNRQGSDIPRRQYRGSRPARDPDLDRRIPIGRRGEDLASWFLHDVGLTIEARNLKVGSGEVDIVAVDAGRPVVVEVRTVTGSHYPLDAITSAKRTQVRQLAQMLGISRCDAIGIGLHGQFFVAHWDPDSF